MFVIRHLYASYGIFMLVQSMKLYTLQAVPYLGIIIFHLHIFDDLKIKLYLDCMIPRGSNYSVSACDPFQGYHITIMTTELAYYRLLVIVYCPDHSCCINRACSKDVT